jgi:hypothetical protein
VKERQREIKERPRDALAVHRHVPLLQMPAARADEEGRHGVVQPIAFPPAVKGDGAPDRVLQIDLTLHLVAPARGARVLEVGHVGIGARVQRVDHHLALDGAGDLHTPPLERRRQGRDAPLALADGARAGQELRHLTGIDALLALRTGREQRTPVRLEAPMQPGEKRERLGAEDLLEARLERRLDAHALRQIEWVHGVAAILFESG